MSAAAVRSVRERDLPAGPWPALAGLVVLAAVLRLATLGLQSIWFDEAATWQLTQLPFGDMLRALPHRESNPPLFYVLEWLTVRAAGDGEVGLRLVSALAGIALVPVAFALGRRIGGARAGLATAALIAVNPLLIWFSQEARSYELVALLSAAGLLLFLHALDDPRPRLLAWWTLLSALALCSHYFACFVLAPQLVWLLWRHPRRGAVLASVAALAVVAAALLPLLLAQRDNPYDIAGAAVATRLAQIPKQFLLGYRGPGALPTGILGAALVAGGLWLLARHAERRVRERALLVGAIGLCGLALPLAGAVVGADYLNARNLIPAVVPLAAAIATGFATVAPGRGARAGLALLTALCALSVAVVIAVAADKQYQRPDWKGLAQALGDAPEDRAVVVSPANGVVALRYYRRELRMVPWAGLPLRAVDVVTVASSPGPGDPPVLPPQVGSALPDGAWGPPRRTRTSTYELLRFRQPTPTVVVPERVAAVRFSQLPPAVDLLPAGR
ncbi:glycosyltransferase family 39 protein [Conexibacter sp. JD483]|uniref:glycosyltransferase family 39 protein n=1 Tax=unclassified Conexibacter TaxID=2627773 RepID=UPI0027293CFC|nr:MULTISPECIES: glycosyltransferase family 39 protein [unclassified Conexibacter]MDO8184052.1 glycosyltransferase family 39 protein [Conexibacter sp. CPCC 205706]MDO8197044.1 glycosyltransferase family 39 protein [Conexibacter sp. CPCC 205762]MDR9367960.1 glycosyltransferase family 39 protein [Conexibacter sp. JD483]